MTNQPVEIRELEFYEAQLEFDTDALWFTVNWWCVRCFKGWPVITSANKVFIAKLLGGYLSQSNFDYGTLLIILVWKLISPDIASVQFSLTMKNIMIKKSNKLAECISW